MLWQIVRAATFSDPLEGGKILLISLIWVSKDYCRSTYVGLSCYCQLIWMRERVVDDSTVGTNRGTMVIYLE